MRRAAAAHKAPRLSHHGLHILVDTEKRLMNVVNSYGLHHKLKRQAHTQFSKEAEIWKGIQRWKGADAVGG